MGIFFIVKLKKKNPIHVNGRIICICINYYTFFPHINNNLCV